MRTTIYLHSDKEQMYQVGSNLGLKGRVSCWIRWFCSIFNGFKKVKFSHVGMVVRDMDAGGKDRIALFESTSIDGGVKGVRLVALSDAIQNYDGQVFVRRLILMDGSELIDGLTKQQIIALHLFIANNLGKPYEKHVLELMGAATPWFWGKGNNDDFFLHAASEVSIGLDVDKKTGAATIVTVDGRPVGEAKP